MARAGSAGPAGLCPKFTDDHPARGNGNERSANFNGQTPKIDPANAAMLLIDHQSGLFQTVKDMPMTELRANATTPG